MQQFKLNFHVQDLIFLTVTTHNEAARIGHTTRPEHPGQADRGVAHHAPWLLRKR
jgi:hypothetical protein